MQPMSTQDLVQFIASANSWSETGKIDIATYQRELGSTWQVANSINPRGAYLFSVNDWDVFELLNGNAVKMATETLKRGSLRLPTSRDKESDPAPPSLRYIFAVPGGSQQLDDYKESMRILNQPIIDRAVVIAMVLTDGDTYIPAGATYTGAHLDEAGKQQVLRMIDEVADGLDEDLEQMQIQPAPILPASLKQMIVLFRTRELDNREQAALVQELMGLDDLSFYDALSRLLPSAWRMNSWLATQPMLCQRMFDLKRQMNLSNRIRLMPNKSGWMRPTPYEPTVTYIMPTISRMGGPAREFSKGPLTRPDNSSYGWASVT